MRSTPSSASRGSAPSASPTARASCTSEAARAVLDELLASADVVIAAAGSAHMVKPEQVKEGVIVLDVGVSRVTGEDGTSRVLGDVDPAVKEKAAWMAPNPGGVGPMTRVMLLANVVEAAERAADGEDWAGERAGA